MAIYQETNKAKLPKNGYCWYFRCYYTNAYGKRKQKQSKMFKNKSIAKDAEREFLNSVLNNDFLSKKTLVVDDLYLEYETSVSEQKNKDSSNYASYLMYKNHISPILGKKEVDKVTVADIRNLHNIMNNKTYFRNGKEYYYSHKTKTKVHTLLSCMLDYAVSMEYAKENVAKRHGNFLNQKQDIIIEEEQIIYQTPLEYERFMSVIDDLEWEIFFSFLYWTGCRKGEIQALKWGDIDFKNSLIRINKTLANKIKGGGFKLTNTKNRKNRKISIIDNLKPLLLKWYEKCQTQYGFNEKWFVFGGIRYCANTTIDKYKDIYYKKVSELYPNTQRLTIHQFGRHSHASLLISLGVDIESIAERLGDTPEVIRKTYAHLFPTYNDDINSKLNSKNIDKLKEKLEKYQN